jgi:hypothetical protein
MWGLFLVLLVAVIVILLTLRNVNTPKATIVNTPKIATLQTLPDPIQQFYPPIKNQIPLDHPPKQIGCCPYSKPMSTALPPADIPMCLAAAPAPA